MKEFMLEILTPERDFFKGEVQAVILDIPTGEIEIMYHTLPMVVCLSPGVINIRQNNRQMQAVCSDGFVRVGDTVTIMTQSCNWPYEIDETETDHEITRLNDKVKKAQSLREYKLAKAQLAIQLARFKIKDKNI